MKNLLAIFVILLISVSNAAKTHIKKEAKATATELEKLKEENKQVGGIPTYSKTPFQLYIDSSIHGEMQSPTKLFYFKKDLSKLILKGRRIMYLPSAGSYKDQKNLFRTTVYIPTQMARLEVEIFINHFNYNLNYHQKYNFSMDLYMGTTKIGTTEFKGQANPYPFYVHRSLNVNGEIFNVPAGNYDFYAKFDSKTNGTGYYSYRFRHDGISTRNEYYYRSHLDYDQGHMEITGYPLN
jgi:hypothetical protein